MKHLFLNGPQWIALRTVSVSSLQHWRRKVVVVVVLVVVGWGWGRQSGPGLWITHGLIRRLSSATVNHTCSWKIERKKKERAGRCSSLKCFLTGETNKQTAYWIKSASPRCVSDHYTCTTGRRSSVPSSARRRLAGNSLPWPPWLRLSSLWDREVVPTCHAQVIICAQTAPSVVTAK